MLMHPTWTWTVAAMCRASDPDRAPKFFKAMDCLGAKGSIGDLDDGPEQVPLPCEAVTRAAVSVLPAARYDVVFTHSPFGEYTRHRRHEETARAVLALWRTGRLRAGELRLFAYEDGRGGHRPRAIRDAHQIVALPEEIWRKKHSIIVDIYGFQSGSFEADTTPREEAFWCFDSPAAAGAWVQGKAPEA
ncbi:MAG TPA: PIG-L family deacetylase [Phycisphaerae bacterium]|nr:PIG-L family deacetylase [Phycisphaerae bacterium]HUT58818.1 PIG-L family deacetylase [Phycisphaerae bacterium]